MYSNINELLNKTIIKIEKTFGDFTNSSDYITFYLSDGSAYKQYHSQYCCEYVYIEDINGDLDDLIGVPLLQAEESSSDAASNTAESATWTFYKFATIKGYVTIRWYGSSNGYYSETACIEKIRDEFPIKEYRKIKLQEIHKTNE